MNDSTIRVENLGKQYRIGSPQASYKTLRESLTDAAIAPFRRLRSVLRGQSSAASHETIWALKAVSFEACPELSRRVKRGEVMGIPSLRQAQYKRQAQGRRWSQRGREDDAYFDRLSTRLKIFSRITEPTEGLAEIHGRVGSLGLRCCRPPETGDPAGCDSRGGSRPCSFG